MKRAILTAFMVAQICGCATVVVSGVKLDEDSWQSDSAELARRFAFEFHCEAQPEFSVLMADGTPPRAVTVGLRGCDRQAVYRLGFGGWVLNSEEVGSEKKITATLGGRKLKRRSLTKKRGSWLPV